jgi:hypothetical protein
MRALSWSALKPKAAGMRTCCGTRSQNDELAAAHAAVERREGLGRRRTVEMRKAPRVNI